MKFDIIFFALLASLSLYRGPLNLFGLGSGIAALIIGLGTLNPMAVMGAFLSSERIQSCADPTNTQNVWTANFVRVDVNLLTRKLLPYLWSIAIIGVIISSFLYFYVRKKNTRGSMKLEIIRVLRVSGKELGSEDAH